MRILVITRNAWDDTNAIGNTMSNFFSGMEDVEFANIYFREASPHNHLCREYYATSEVDVLKKWFSPKRIGRHFCVTAQEDRQRTLLGNKEKNLVRMIQKYGIRLAYSLSDRIWYSEKWINERLDAFIESFAPDLIFSFVKSAPQYYLTIKYLREKYHIPLLSWIADDEYTGLSQHRRTREIENLRYILSQSAYVMGCSKEICDYYQKVFGCRATPFYKSCDFSTQVKSYVNQPLKIVYAGNLLYGRLDTICKISRVIEEISDSGIEIDFFLYSNTMLSAKDIKNCFEQTPHTHYMGRKDYQEIKSQLASADIVLHVESFETQEILKTRYSFSTKIIDYLQSGSVVLAVGPAEVASMRYMSGVPGICVVSDSNHLKDEIFNLVCDTAKFQQYATETRIYAKQHHDAEQITKELKLIMQTIVEGGV